MPFVRHILLKLSFQFFELIGWKNVWFVRTGSKVEEIGSFWWVKHFVKLNVIVLDEFLFKFLQFARYWGVKHCLFLSDSAFFTILVIFRNVLLFLDDLPNSVAFNDFEKGVLTDFAYFILLGFLNVLLKIFLEFLAFDIVC